MTNYDMDEIERERERNAFATAKKDEGHTVEIELADEDLLKLALAAHDKDITLNQMCVHILADSLKDKSFKLELPTKPTVLKEY